MGVNVHIVSNMNETSLCQALTSMTMIGHKYLIFISRSFTLHTGLKCMATKLYINSVSIVMSLKFSACICGRLCLCNVNAIIVENTAIINKYTFHKIFKHA